MNKQRVLHITLENTLKGLFISAYKKKDALMLLNDVLQITDDFLTGFRVKGEVNNGYLLILGTTNRNETIAIRVNFSSVPNMLEDAHDSFAAFFANDEKELPQFELPIASSAHASESVSIPVAYEIIELDGERFMVTGKVQMQAK